MIINLITHYIFNKILASYSRCEKKTVPYLTKHWQCILNARKGAFQESKIPMLFLKPELNEPLASHVWPIHTKNIYN